MENLLKVARLYTLYMSFFSKCNADRVNQTRVIQSGLSTEIVIISEFM